MFNQALLSFIETSCRQGAHQSPTTVYFSGYPHMSAKKPIRFFFPTRTADTQVQTPFFLRRVKPRRPVIDRLRSESVESIVSQEFRPADNVELSIKLDYNARLQFYLANLNDPSFDVLTPPPGLFEDYPVGLEVQFCNEFMQFAAVGRPEKVQYSYDRRVFPLIASLESGLVDGELLSVIHGHLKIKEWENGCILCKITDFRFPEPVEFKRMLRLSDSVVLSAVDPESAHVLESEREAIHVMHPSVCVDPSPDVARVQSVIDWREKMWRRRGDIEEKAMVIHPHVEVNHETPGNVTLKPLTEDIVIPEAIFEALARPSVPT